MAERYTGTVMLIGPQEVGQTGRNKPRKLVVSDDPENYDGKTFRVWDDDGSIDKLNGKIVTLDYETRQIPNRPPEFRQNLVSNISLAEDPVQLVEGTMGAQVVEEIPNQDYQQSMDKSTEGEIVGPADSLLEKMQAAVDFLQESIKELRWKTP